MIVTFCGHSDFTKSKELESRLMDYLEQAVGENKVEMFLGGYGRFDSFAYECCKKFKALHANVKLLFVTPYLTKFYQKNLELIKAKYDEVVYPPIEAKPPKFAIYYRNRFMVEKADVVIAYVGRKWGGAYTTLKYANSKNKKIFNLAGEKI